MTKITKEAIALARAYLANVKAHITVQNAQAAASTVLGAAKDHVVEHPIKTTVMTAGLIAPPILGTPSVAAYILSFIGFGPLGPIAGTAATWYQSTFLGGYISAGSMFAFLQRMGMTIGV